MEYSGHRAHQTPGRKRKLKPRHWQRSQLCALELKPQLSGASHVQIHTVEVVTATYGAVRIEQVSHPLQPHSGGLYMAVLLVSHSGWLRRVVCLRCEDRA